MYDNDDNDDNDDNQPTGGSELSTAIPSTSEPRMSSLEIAKITEKQHRNVLRDIEKTLTEVGIDLPKFESIFLDSYKREQPCYLLPRRECDLIMTGEDAWIKLKDKPGTHRHRLRQKNGVRDILRAFWALDYEKLNPALKAVFRPIYEREHEEQAAIHAIHSKP